MILGGRVIQLTIWGTLRTVVIFYLRAFVVTAVILTPGARGREGLGRTSLRRSAGSRGIPGRVLNSYFVYLGIEPGTSGL